MGANARWGTKDEMAGAKAAKEHMRSPWCHLYRLYPFEVGSQGGTKSFPNTLLKDIKRCDFLFANLPLTAARLAPPREI